MTRNVAAPRIYLWITLALTGSTHAQRSYEQRAPTTRLATKVVHVPMKHRSGHVAVLVEINGRGPYRFLLDTGASGHGRIDRSLVEPLGLRRIGTSLTDDGTRQKIRKNPIVRVDRIELGGVTFEKLDLGVASYKDWLDKDGDRPTVGLLGFGLFARLLLSIDYAQGSLRLERGELPARGKHVMSYGVWKGIPRIRAQLGRRRFELAIDTGNDAGLILPSAWLDGLRVEREPRVVATARTTNNEFRVSATVLREPLFVARHSLGWVEAHFAKIWKQPNLGYRLLKQYVLTFDQKNKRVRFGVPERTK